MNRQGNFFQGAPCQGLSISGIDPNVQTSVNSNEWIQSDVQISASRADSGMIAWCPNPLPTSLLVPHFPSILGSLYHLAIVLPNNTHPSVRNLLYSHTPYPTSRLPKSPPSVVTSNSSCSDYLHRRIETPSR